MQLGVRFFNQHGPHSIGVSRTSEQGLFSKHKDNLLSFVLSILYYTLLRSSDAVISTRRNVSFYLAKWITRDEVINDNKLPPSLLEDLNAVATLEDYIANHKLEGSSFWFRYSAFLIFIDLLCPLDQSVRTIDAEHIP